MHVSMSAIIGTFIGILVLIAAIYGLRTADKRRKAEALRRAKQAEKEAQAKAARRAKRRAKKIAQIERVLEQERTERERYEEATRTQVIYADFQDLQDEQDESIEQDDATPSEESMQAIENATDKDPATVISSETADRSSTETSSDVSSKLTSSLSGDIEDEISTTPNIPSQTADGDPEIGVSSESSKACDNTSAASDPSTISTDAPTRQSSQTVNS